MGRTSPGVNIPARALTVARCPFKSLRSPSPSPCPRPPSDPPPPLQPPADFSPNGVRPDLPSKIFERVVRPSPGRHVVGSAELSGDGADQQCRVRGLGCDVQANQQRLADKAERKWLEWFRKGEERRGEKCDRRRIVL
jgi:hypothetical protein